MKTSLNMSNVMFDDDDFIDMLLEAETSINVSDDLPILDDLNDLKFRFTSYFETDGSEDYKLGVEQGLLLASNMIDAIIKKYS